MRRLIVILLLSSSCSLSNAFLGFPDFITNEGACRDSILAFDAAQCACDELACGTRAAEDLDTRCPSRLNERDSRCTDFFRCEQENGERAACSDGSFDLNLRDCGAEFSGVVCTDPFDDIDVAVTFSIEFEGADDCAEAGVGFLLTRQSQDVPTCATGVSHRITIKKSVLPTFIGILGVDVRGLGQEVLFVGASAEEVDIEDLDENDAVDVGVIVLQPGDTG